MLINKQVQVSVFRQTSRQVQCRSPNFPGEALTKIKHAKEMCSVTNEPATKGEQKDRTKDSPETMWHSNTIYMWNNHWQLKGSVVLQTRQLYGDTCIFSLDKRQHLTIISNISNRSNQM